MKYLILVLAVFAIGCEQPSGSSNPAAKEPTATNPIAPSLPVTVVPTPSTAPAAPTYLTYFKLVKVANPTISGHSVGPITMTGACVIYKTITYCWDDGAQGYADFVFGTTHYGPVYESYWNIGWNTAHTNLINCAISCQNDPYTQPTKLSSFNGGISTTSMFATGTPTVVSCTESNGILDCVDFQIDLNQAAI